MGKRDKGAVTALVASHQEAGTPRAQQRKQALDLVAQIRRNLQAITDAFFEIGEALTLLNNNRMYVALGYESFADAMRGLHLMSQTQANKLIAVAELVPREAAIRMGPEKSYALTCWR